MLKSFFSQQVPPIPVCLYFRRFARYVYIKVKDAVKKKDSANSVRDGGVRRDNATKINRDR